MRLVIADQLTAFFLAHLIVGFYISIYLNNILIKLDALINNIKTNIHKNKYLGLIFILSLLSQEYQNKLLIYSLYYLFHLLFYHHKIMYKFLFDMYS